MTAHLHETGTGTGEDGVNTLQAWRTGIDTHQEPVVYMRRDCPVCRSEGFTTQARVQLTAGRRSIVATLSVVDGDWLAENVAGLSESAWASLGAQPGQLVTVTHAPPLDSLSHVRAKVYGNALGDAEFSAIISDVAAGHYSDLHLATFITACAGDRLDLAETVSLTKAMIGVGDRIDWGRPLVVDKHCVGGLPGNRTTLLVVPIVAACGLTMPKTSSRAITSPAGTADTMEVLTEVELPVERLLEIVREHRGCIAWGGTAQLSPADDVLISVERPLSIDSPGQMVASILSKKIAAGSTHLVLDIPIGPTAKVRSMPEAQRLRRLFEYVAGRMHLALDVVITDGRQPIGNGIGPVLEARDVMQVLQNDPRAPIDLRQKALRLAGRLIECDPDVRGGDGFAIARDILDSGRALSCMNAIIEAQGSQSFDPNAPQLGALSFEVRASTAGLVAGIDNVQIARIARLAGAPKVPGAGVDLLRKLGHAVSAGDLLYRVHASYPADLEFARQACARASGFTIGGADAMPHVFVEF